MNKDGFLRFVVGDATRLGFGGNSRKYLCHIVNDVGKWGAGFVLALSRRWPFVASTYRRYWRQYRLGDMQRVSVGGRVTVVNVFGQRGVRSPAGAAPIRYGAVRKALRNLGEMIQKRGSTATVHMPRMSCGLAGGGWAMVEVIVREELVGRGIRVYVYDLPKGKA